MPLFISPCPAYGTGTGRRTRCYGLGTGPAATPDRPGGGLPRRPGQGNNRGEGRRRLPTPCARPAAFQARTFGSRAPVWRRLLKAGAQGRSTRAGGNLPPRGRRRRPGGLGPPPQPGSERAMRRGRSDRRESGPHKRPRPFPRGTAGGKRPVRPRQQTLGDTQRADQAAAWGAREASARWAVRRSRKRPERVMRNEPGDRSKGAPAKIEHADTRVLRSGAGRRSVADESAVRRRRARKGTPHGPCADAGRESLRQGADADKAAAPKKPLRSEIRREKRAGGGEAAARRPAPKTPEEGADQPSYRSEQDPDGHDIAARERKGQRGPSATWHRTESPERGSEEARPTPPCRAAGPDERACATTGTACPPPELQRPAQGIGRSDRVGGGATAGGPKHSSRDNDAQAGRPQTSPRDEGARAAREDGRGPPRAREGPTKPQYRRGRAAPDQAPSPAGSCIRHTAPGGPSPGRSERAGVILLLYFSSTSSRSKITRITCSGFPSTLSAMISAAFILSLAGVL